MNSHQASKIDGISDVNCKAVAETKTPDCVDDHSRSSFDALIDVSRKRLVRIVLDHFIVQHVVQVPGSEAGYSEHHEKDNPLKRKSGQVIFEGDPRFVLPLMYVENIYSDLVSEVDARMDSGMYSPGRRIGLDVEAAGGLYMELARKFPEKGPYTFKRRELATLGEARTKFPEFKVQLEKRVYLLAVIGLDVVEKPSTLSLADAEWFKSLTGRSEVSIPSQDYKRFSLRNEYQGVVSNPLASTTRLPVEETIKTNIVAPTNVQTKQPIVPTKQPSVPLSFQIDHTQLFTTNKTFKNSVKAMKWVIRIGNENQTVLGKYSTTYCSRGKVKTCWMKCEGRIGFPECRFKLKCYSVDDGPWKVMVLRGIHSHKIGKSLTKKKCVLAKELLPSQSLPKQVLQQIKGNIPTNVTTLKEVSNARYCLWEEDLGGRTVLQHFLAQTWVLDGLYFQRHREARGTGGQNDLVFAHTQSLPLLKAFPYVLIVDATTLGNRFKTSFFEVRGVAPTYRNFNVACAFLAAKREDNYVWALEQVSDMCWYAGITPTTIMTVADPDQPLFTAVERAFPDSKHLLCRRHICRSIKDKCVKRIPSAFVSACKTLFKSKTESEYEERLQLMEDFWRGQGLTGYLKSVWLFPYKDRIVSAWTDNVVHFGIHDTKRIASPVKELLNSSSSGSEVWGMLHSLLERETTQVNESILQSQKEVLDIVPYEDAFSLLQHSISSKAIKIMVQELKCLTSGDKNSSTCECKLRVTHGLPCAHEITKLVADRPIPLDAVHEFWRQLNLDDVVRSTFKNDHWRRKCAQMFEKMGQGKTIPENFLSSLLSSDKLNQSHESSASPTSSGERKSCSVESSVSKPFVNPPSIIHDKPSKKTYVEEPYVCKIPNFMVPYVTKFFDYSANGGHGGFQAIAEEVEYGEDGWRRVREELFKELACNSSTYASIFKVEKILKALAAWTLHVPPDQQFFYKEMGHIVATCYQLVFVVLGQESVTFLPLYAEEEIDLSDLPVFCLVCLDQGRKFISLTMEEGFPLPPVQPLWALHHATNIDGLDLRYGERLKKYEWFQSFMGTATPLGKS